MKIGIPAGILAGVAACAALTVPAQAQPRALSDCHAIASGAERLACYDAASGRPAAPKAEVQKNATDVQYHHWRRHHRHRHHHGYYYQPYGYYAPQPGVGIYLRTW